MPNVTVTNLTASNISCDVGLVVPGTPLTVAMGPVQAYRAAEGLKTLVDAGRVSVAVADETAKLDLLELYPGQMQSIDVTIPAASMLTLNATPFTLIPAPGVGLALVFEGALVTLSYAGTAYAGIAAGEDLSFKYTGSAGLEVAEVETTGFLDATTNQIRFARAQTAATLISSITPVANAPLVAHMLAGEVTTGNSPIKMRIFYRVLPAVL